VHDGRATLVGGLTADYLATLLDSFDRALTPKEIVQSFYKNPAFPLVPSTDEVRRVLFDLLDKGWEFVDSDGNRLAVASPGQVQINSISQTLQRCRPRVPEPVTREGATNPDDENLSAGGKDGPFGGNDNQSEKDGDIPPGGSTDLATYKRYRVTLTNRSITALEVREQVWQLIKELAKVIDPAGEADHQLISLEFTLTTASGHQGSIEDKGMQAGGRVAVEDDEF
jgi:hypothetical protein